ncbi:MAG: T9SS type A sorting domain-containing protein [Bacteroidales bacterium]|nr:T9SS type A sorting domain-containing protein [Bacteroidales bacterium]
MRYKRLKLSVIFFLSFVVGIKAQESINTIGNNAMGSGGFISFSVGQIVYQTYADENNSLAEGVQQPYEISVVSAIKKFEETNFSILAYPNPTTECLTLRVNEFKMSNLSYQLYDMNGKLLRNEKITENQTSIVMSNFVPAIYFVKVTMGNKKVITFKIIKN